MLVKVTSLGLTLGSALSGGCMYYPSICSNKQAIEQLDGEIQVMTRKYDKEYVNAKENYYNLKIATINNGYIKYHINQTMRAVEKIQEIEETLTSSLECMFPKLYEMANASDSETSEQYLKHVIGSLEYRLTDLETIIRDNRKMALIGVVVQFVIEVTIKKFVSAIQTAYTQVLSNEDILDTTSDMLWGREEGSRLHSPTSSRFKFAQKLKIAPKVVKQMATNFGQKFRDISNNIRKWTNIKSWTGFKNKLASTFKPTLIKLARVKQFFTPSSEKFFRPGYKMTPSHAFMHALSILGDAVSTALQIKQWKDVSDKLEESRRKYEEYHGLLSDALKKVENETIKMNSVWDDVIDVFQHLSIPFKQLVENATNFSNFSEVMGLARIPFNSSDAIFSINFDRVTNESIKSQQDDVIRFLRKVNINMSEIQNQMLAREILYNNTFSNSESNKTIGEMKYNIKNILRFNPSGTVKDFGNNLTLFDVVCTVSVLRYDLDEYDFFPISEFRPRCDVNDTTFELFKQNAYSKRKFRLMRALITRNVNSSDESLSRLLDIVHNAYSAVADKDIASFGQTITEQDVICAVAEIFSNQSMYDFIDLNVLRLNCFSVNNGQFQKILNDANKLRNVAAAVISALDGCKQYKFCPCLSTVARNNHATVSEIEYAIKQIEHSWQPNPEAMFCGPTGCSCRHL